MRKGTDLPPAAAPAALATLLVIDAFVLPRLPLRPISGIVDETAHAATGVALLAAWPDADEEFTRGLAAGSILLDIDHVPELWGRRWLRPRGVRPLPHSFGIPAALLALAVRGSNRAALGATVGLGGHLLRDLATGKTAVPLLWPLTKRPFSVRYRKYVAVMAVLAAVGAARATGGSGSAPPPRASHPGSPPPPAPSPAPAPGRGSGGQ
jgi:membrane-bound metal-dependent hydrolase YbcI (DUF457 family)